jgi:hypothetical protein
LSPVHIWPRGQIWISSIHRVRPSPGLLRPAGNCPGTAQHCGFTEEELDFIPSLLLRTGVNYDTRLHRSFGGQVKYRLGRDAGEETE